MSSRPFSVPADDFPEPMLLVSPDGEVLAINRAAREDFGAGYPATHLCDLVADAREKVMAFVRLCSSTRDAIPGALAGRLEPAEVFHEVLEHRWFLSEQAGHDVGTTRAARSYFDTVLPRTPKELTTPSAIVGGRD